MRDIKFRAWHEGNNNFEYATLFNIQKNGFEICEAVDAQRTMPHTTQKYFADDEAVNELLKTSFYSGLAEWQQYTGLKDKNGKEIYEGDIVHCWGGEHCQGYWEYDDKITINNMINDCFMMGGSEFIEVTSNIYEQEVTK